MQQAVLLFTEYMQEIFYVALVVLLILDIVALQKIRRLKRKNRTITEEMQRQIHELVQEQEQIKNRLQEETEFEQKQVQARTKSTVSPEKLIDAVLTEVFP